MSGVSLQGADSQSDRCENFLMRHCLLYQNGSYGIYLDDNFYDRIDRNHIVMHTNAGIYANIAYSNLVVRNTGSGNGATNYNLHASNTRGPYVTDRGALSTITGTNSLSPWANFSR
jgi:parallel beta-helix repeat protein